MLGKILEDNIEIWIWNWNILYRIIKTIIFKLKYSTKAADGRVSNGISRLGEFDCLWKEWRDLSFTPLYSASSLSTTLYFASSLSTTLYFASSLSTTSSSSSSASRVSKQAKLHCWLGRVENCKSSQNQMSQCFFKSLWNIETEGNFFLQKKYFR